MAGWIPDSTVKADDTAYESVDVLVDDTGREIALVEDFGNACYPCAINCHTGNLERGGPCSDRVAAVLWCERVAGLSPAKPSDERPPFYYKATKPQG